VQERQPPAGPAQGLAGRLERCLENDTLTDFQDVGQGSYSKVSSAQLGKEAVRVAIKEPKTGFQDLVKSRIEYAKVGSRLAL
jgi:hypothetical protein